MAKQNLTIQLDRATITKAKLLAAVRETSVSKLVSHLIEDLIRNDDGYREAQQVARRLLKRGFPLGGSRRGSRDALHER